LARVFRYDAGTLEVDQPALLNLVSQDARIEEVSLAAVHPGEKARVTGIRVS